MEKLTAMMLEALALNSLATSVLVELGLAEMREREVKVDRGKCSLSWEWKKVQNSS